VVASWAFQYLVHPETIARFVGKGLGIVDERISSIAPIRDYVCLLERCYEGGLIPDSFSAVVAMFAGMLGENWTQSTSGQGELYSKFLQSIKNNRGKLQSVFLSKNSEFGLPGLGFRSGNDILSANLATIPRYLKPLVNFVQTQNGRYNNYLRTGLYSGRQLSSIAFDLSPETLGKVRAPQVQG
jgi:hypothetical protein